MSDFYRVILILPLAFLNVYFTVYVLTKTWLRDRERSVTMDGVHYSVHPAYLLTNYGFHYLLLIIVLILYSSKPDEHILVLIPVVIGVWFVIRNKITIYLAESHVRIKYLHKTVQFDWYDILGVEHMYTRACDYYILKMSDVKDIYIPHNISGLDALLAGILTGLSREDVDFTKTLDDLPERRDPEEEFRYALVITTVLMLILSVVYLLNISKM